MLIFFLLFLRVEIQHVGSFTHYIVSLLAKLVILAIIYLMCMGTFRQLFIQPTALPTDPPNTHGSLAWLSAQVPNGETNLLPDTSGGSLSSPEKKRLGMLKFNIPRAPPYTQLAVLAKIGVFGHLLCRVYGQLQPWLLVECSLS